MKISKLKILGLIGIVGAVGGILLKKLLIVILVGLLSLQSALASLPSSVPISDDLPKTISQSSESSLLTQIPRIRNAPVELGDALPGDFLATRQMPLSSGRREVLLVSASTGTEQRYLINMPGNSAFQLHQVDFKNVSGFDPNRIIRDETQLSSGDVHTALRTFSLTFQNGNPDRLTLADGGLIIVSAKGWFKRYLKDRAWRPGDGCERDVAAVGEPAEASQRVGLGVGQRSVLRR